MKNIFVLSILTLSACSTLSLLQVAKIRIDDKIKDHQDQFRKCYDDQYPEGEKKEGTIKIWFIVDLDGSVSKTSLKSSTLDNPIVEQCMMKQLTEMSFESNLDEKPVELVYPFRFSKEKK